VLDLAELSGRTRSSRVAPSGSALPHSLNAYLRHHFGVVSGCREAVSTRERDIMKMPSKISAWFMILFFLLFGLAAFVSALQLPWLEGILALGAAIFLFLDR
jgi:hypothetical protein